MTPSKSPKTPSLVEKHLADFPNARASTLARLIAKEEVKRQLKIDAKRNRRRRLPWWAFWRAA